MYIKSPINYVGSKYALLPKLIPLFPKTSTFIDLFTGGGSVYMNVKSLYATVIANDIISDLIQIHKNLHSREFVLQAAKLSIETINSQDSYNVLRNNYNVTKDPVMLLALIWSCNSGQMRFNKNGEFNQTWGKRGFNKSKASIVSTFYKTAMHTNVYFSSKSFKDVLIPNDSFVYIDPPYSNTGAGYNTTWDSSDDSNLIEYIRGLISAGILFGVSGTENNTYNPVLDFLRTQELQSYWFGNLYEKVSKKEKSNNEYYFTNFNIGNDHALDT